MGPSADRRDGGGRVRLRCLGGRVSGRRRGDLARVASARPLIRRSGIVNARLWRGRRPARLLLAPDEVGAQLHGEAFGTVGIVGHGPFYRARRCLDNRGALGSRRASPAGSRMAVLP